MKFIRPAVAVLIVLCSFLANAQDDSTSISMNSYFEKYRPAKQWSVGVQLSPTHAMSDADNPQLGFAYGLHVKYSVG